MPIEEDVVKVNWRLSDGGTLYPEVNVSTAAEGTVAGGQRPTYPRISRPENSGYDSPIRSRIDQLPHFWAGPQTNCLAKHFSFPPL